jgi:competence protein ComEC
MWRWWAGKTLTFWLICALAVGFIAGCALSYLPATAELARPMWPMFASALLLFSLLSRTRIFVVLTLIAGLILGLWRGEITRVDLSSYTDWLGQSVVLRGDLKEDPDLGADGTTSAKLTNLQIITAADYANLLQKLGGDESASADDFADSSEQTAQIYQNLADYFTPLPGVVYASFAGAATPQRSDQIELRGKLDPGFGTFSASLYRAQVVAVYPGADPARDVRDAFGEKLRMVIDEPAASLGMGILAGQKTALPAALTAAFLAASLTHIVVASGYNLTILVRFARRLFARISRRAALILAGLLVLAFACVTGFSPSMTRASLVALLSLAAWYFGRNFHPLALLTFAAAITLAFDPTQIWGDVGWYLSFLSFAGVLMLAPLIREFFWGKKTPQATQLTTNLRTKLTRLIQKSRSTKPKYDSHEPLLDLRAVVLETLSAQILAAPFIALVMGNFSPYGLLANVVILPLLPLTMLLTFIAGIGALILPPGLAQVIALPAQWLLDFIIQVATWVSELPGALAEIAWPTWFYFVAFGAILLIMILLKWKTKHNFREDSLVE